MEEQIAAVSQYETNMVTASQTLSDEALTYLRGMGIEAAPLLQQFVDAPLDQQQRLNQVWSQLGQASTDGYKTGEDLVGAVNSSIDAAQATASGRPLQFSTELNTSSWQRTITNAINGVHVPAIVVKARLGQAAI